MNPAKHPLRSAWNIHREAGLRLVVVCGQRLVRVVIIILILRWPWSGSVLRGARRKASSRKSASSAPETSLERSKMHPKQLLRASKRAESIQKRAGMPTNASISWI